MSPSPSKSLRQGSARKGADPRTPQASNRLSNGQAHAQEGMSSSRSRAKELQSSPQKGGLAQGVKGKVGIVEFLQRTDLSPFERLSLIKEMLATGVDPNQLVRVQWQPFRTSLLLESCVNGEHPFVRILLDHKADPEIPHGPAGFTCLYNAALYGHTNVVQMLCEHAVSVDKPTVDGLSPLYVASQEGHEDCVEALLWAKTMTPALAAKPLPDSLGGHSPLHVASQNGHIKVVDLLLEVGKVPPDARNTTTDAATPLMLALHMAGKSPGARHLNCAQVLIRGGASLFATDAHGRMALSWAPEEWRDALHTYMLECAPGGGGGDDAGLLKRVGRKAHKEPYKSPADELDARGRGRSGLRAGASRRHDPGFMAGLASAFGECLPCAPRCCRPGKSNMFPGV